MRQPTIRSTVLLPTRRASRRGLVLASLLLAVCIGPRAVAEDSVDGRLSDAQRTELVDLLEASLERTRELTADLSSEDWGRVPSEGGWSIAQVVEHILLGEQQIVARFDQVLEGDPDPAWQELAGIGLDPILDFARDRSQKFQAPEPIIPTGSLSKKVALERLESRRRATIDLVRTTDATLDRYTLRAPSGRVNLRHWLGFAVGHADRHNLQIAEIRASLSLD